MQIPKQRHCSAFSLARMTGSPDRRWRAIVLCASCTWRCKRPAARWGSAIQPASHHEDPAPEDLPLVIEIVDSEDKINGFLPTLIT